MPVAALCILLLASPPGDLTAGSRPSPARAPTTIAAVALTSEGLDREALREALALRAPDVRLLPTGAACEARCAVVLARRGEGGIIAVEARLADGRVFTRRLDSAAEQPERALATSLAHLLAAIDGGTAIPEPTAPSDPPTPDPTPDEAPAPRVPAPSPDGPGAQRAPAPAREGPAPPPDALDEPPDPARDPPPAPSRFELGPTFGLVSSFGAGPPRTLAGSVGAGFIVDLELRTRRGLLASFGLRALQQRDSGHRLQRLRLALATGYSLRRGPFELRARAAVTLEPWWVAHRADGARVDIGPLLLGGALSLAPGVHAALGPRLRLHAGLRIEAAASAAARRFAVIQVNDPAGAPLFRLGGLELSALAEIGARWGLPARP